MVYMIKVLLHQNINGHIDVVIGERMIAVLRNVVWMEHAMSSQMDLRMELIEHLILCIVGKVLQTHQHIVVLFMDINPLRPMLSGDTILIKTVQ